MRLKAIARINAIEKQAQAQFEILREHLHGRLNDNKDALYDYEVEVEVLAISAAGKQLYDSNINHNLFSKRGLDYEYLAMNHNDHPCDVEPSQREYHSYLYHDLVDHSKQYCVYKDTKVAQIAAIVMKVKIWEQFLQKGSDLPRAIAMAKHYLPAHAYTRSLLTHEKVQPNVNISAYMFDEDKDAFIDDPNEKREGVEDPYEGVIRYYGLDAQGDIPEAIAKRVESLWVDMHSSCRLSFEL